MPPHIRAEAEAQTGCNLVENKDAWEKFNYNEWQSDQTPVGRWTILSKWTPLDFILWYGLFRNEAWDRLFYNELEYDTPVTASEVRHAELNPFPGMNLKTSEGKR